MKVNAINHERVKAHQGKQGRRHGRVAERIELPRDARLHAEILQQVLVSGGHLIDDTVQRGVCLVILHPSTYRGSRNTANRIQLN